MDKTKALQKLLVGTATKKEIEQLKQALASGEISIGRDVKGSVVIIGSGNTVELTADALRLLNPEATGESEPRYDTRERYISQVIEYNENLDFVGIPELKDRQALRIEDVFVSLQTQVEEVERERYQELSKERHAKDLPGRLGDLRPKVTRRLTISQALTESQRIVVLGDPGSGKTTLLKYIVLAFAENKTDKLGLTETRLPIFIRLYDYVAKRGECGKDGFSFTDYLNKYCADHLQLRLPPDFFEKALENGECCVCFDGLDELGAAGLRREITLAVSAMANRYVRNRFIVTSRLVGYEEAPLDRNDFAHHTVQPLGDEDIKLFVEKWYKARERDVAIRRERTEHLVKTIMSEERIKSLAANPLMLTIIALVHRIEAELPHERVKLYDKCVTTLVETWDKVRGMKTGLRRRLLEKLAYWMHSQPGERGRTREVREGTLRLQLAYFLQADPKNKMDEEEIQKEVENFITVVKTRSGLLVERGEGVYTFSHLTFQEYLAACDIEKRLAHSTDALWKEIQPHLHDARWREVILLLLGSLNRFEEHNSVLIRKIYESSDIYEPVLHRHLFLCAKVLSDHVEVDSGLHDQIVDDLVELSKSNRFVHSEAFQLLRSLQNDSRAINGLLALAEDEKVFAWIRSDAAQALGQLGRVEEAARLLLALAEDEKIDADNDNDGIRIAAMQAVSELERIDDASLYKLLVLVRDEKMDIGVRYFALDTLGKLKCMSHVVLNELFVLAEDKSVNTVIRENATWIIGLLGLLDGAILNRLLELAKDKEIARSVVGALGLLGYSDEAAKLLMALIGSQEMDARDRCAVAEQLGRLGYVEQAVNQLLALTEEEGVHPRELCDVAEALKGLKYINDACKIILAIVGNEEVDFIQRVIVVEMLTGMDNIEDTVLDDLLAIAREEKVDVRVRLALAEKLGQLSHMDEAVRLLLTLADNEKVDASVRYAAIEALGRMGHVDDMGRLSLALMSDEKIDSSVRSDAVQMLCQLKYVDELVLNGLLSIVGDEKLDSNLRSHAAWALGQLGYANELVLSGLLALAEDKKATEFARSNAAGALDKLGYVDKATRLLFILAKDEKANIAVRCSAAQTLDRLGYGDEAGKVLLVIAEDNKVSVHERGMAVELLGKLGFANEACLNELLALAKDEDVPYYVRYTAGKSLQQLLE